MRHDLLKVAVMVPSAAYMLWVLVWLFAPIAMPPAWPAMVAGAGLGWCLGDEIF